MPKFKDISGQKYARLTVIDRAESKSEKTRWNCICECGGTATVFAQYLKSGKTKSCGCFQKEQARAKRFKHGLAVSRNKGYSKKVSLKYKYGLSIERYEEMLVEQNGRCSICGYLFGQKKSDCYVDHCHTTMLVRGLLCQHCNSAIGHARDNPTVLRSAADYLLKFSATEKKYVCS